jgi:sugar phosphate isomerase/epimerase
MLVTKGVGVSLPVNETVGDPERLERKLEKAARLGFDCVELPIQAMRLIRGGELDDRKLRRYEETVRRSGLAVTLHAPFDLNLFRQDDRDTDFRCLMASIEIGGVLGAETLVVHPGRYVGEERLLYPRLWPEYTEDQKEALLREERRLMRLAGDAAKARNVRIGMENLRPWPECPGYSYAVIPGELAEQVAAIGHPHVGIVLDVGHFYLACQFYRLDPKTEIECVRSRVVHLHVHDNFGKPSFAAEKNQHELYALGRGDLHMPIGFGEIPMEQIAEWLGGKADVFLIHEIREMYESEWPVLPKFKAPV